MQQHIRFIMNICNAPFRGDNIFASALRPVHLQLTFKD